MPYLMTASPKCPEKRSVPGCMIRREMAVQMGAFSSLWAWIGSACFYLTALTTQPAWLPSAKSLLFLFCIKPFLLICLFLSRRERERGGEGRREGQGKGRGGRGEVQILEICLFLSCLGLSSFLSCYCWVWVTEISLHLPQMLPSQGSSREQTGLHQCLHAMLIWEISETFLQNYMENKWRNVALFYGRSSEMKLVFNMVMRK